MEYKYEANGRIIVKRLFAYNFKSPLSIEQMFERLKELGVWRWLERDNDRWGDYISASPVESVVRWRFRSSSNSASPSRGVLDVNDTGW